MLGLAPLFIVVVQVQVQVGSVVFVDVDLARFCVRLGYGYGGFGPIKKQE
jgi:hypothetical protein